MQAEGEKRKAADDPLLKVPFTAELGNATPLFITPAEWTSDELQRVAKKTVFATTNNAGCNCLAPKVILMSADWPQVHTTTLCPELFSPPIPLQQPSTSC